jgi:hypothetical protein
MPCLDSGTATHHSQVTCKNWGTCTGVIRFGFELIVLQVTSGTLDIPADPKTLR